MERLVHNINYRELFVSFPSPMNGKTRFFPLKKQVNYIAYINFQAPRYVASQFIHKKIDSK